MKKLKFISAVLSVVMCLSLFGGCTPPDLGDYGYTAVDPGTLAAPRAEFATAEEDAAKNAAYRREYPLMERYPQTVTITVAVLQQNLEDGVKKGTTPKNQTFNQIALEKLNIKLEYTVVAGLTDYDTQLNLAITSGHMPDMFLTGSAEKFADLRDNGMLADLTEAYYMLNDTLLSNYEKYFPEIIKASMKDGKLYALPQQSNIYNNAQRLFIRKDWLKILRDEGSEKYDEDYKPETVQDFVDLAQAFYDNRAKIAEVTGIKEHQVIPFSIHKDLTYAGAYSADGLFNAHGASVGSYFKDENGELYCSSTSPEAKATLETLRYMYDHKLLDPSFASNDANTVSSRISAGFVGMAFGEWWLPAFLGNAVASDRVKNADWTWVDTLTYNGKEGLPVVDTMLIAEYAVVSKTCKHPEAIAKLCNLFFDIYYNDNAQEIYGPSVLPGNGFYYQFVPVKVWDGMTSATEFKRVNKAFNDLYAAGLNERYTNGIQKALTDAQIAAIENSGKKVYRVESSNEAGKYNCIDPDFIDEIEADPVLNAAFNSMRTREKILHFAKGYPYFVAYKQGTHISRMTEAEKKGWGIYHEMIDEESGYAYVVELAEHKKQARYDEFYGGTLTSMKDFSANVVTLTSEVYAKIVSGNSPVSAFDKYVSDYNRTGGATITKQVNAWYKATHKED